VVNQAKFVVLRPRSCCHPLLKIYPEEDPLNAPSRETFALQNVELAAI
jgi:hypothetical protein